MLTSKIRKPAVAGRFYPSDKKELENLISEIYHKEKAKIDLSYSNMDIYGASINHAK